MTPEKLDEIAARDKAWREMEPGGHGEMWTREGLADAYFMACYDRRVLLRREAALREQIEPDLRLVIHQLRENGYSDWPIILERVLALLSEVPQ